MYRFDEIRDREGYYYHRRSGVIIRNVRPERGACGRDPSGAEYLTGEVAGATNASEFELITPDVLLPIHEVRRLVAERSGNDKAPLVNRQTAVQPDGQCLTEESRAR